MCVSESGVEPACVVWCVCVFVRSVASTGICPFGVFASVPLRGGSDMSPCVCVRVFLKHRRGVVVVVVVVWSETYSFIEGTL